MEVDDMLFIRTGELELTFEPKSSLKSERDESKQATYVVDDKPADENTLTYSAYQILTAADPLEKVVRCSFALLFLNM